MMTLLYISLVLNACFIATFVTAWVNSIPVRSDRSQRHIDRLLAEVQLTAENRESECYPIGTILEEEREMPKKGLWNWLFE